jgi:hypothetical protein
MTAASTHHRYAPRGHFRPWAMISTPEVTSAYRVVYPTLLCANNQHASLYDLCTGALVQTINVNRIPQPGKAGPCHVDMDEQHVVVCEPYIAHVFSRDRGTDVFRIRSDVFTPKMKAGTVGSTGNAHRGAFVESGSPLSWRHGDDSRSDFLAGALAFRFPWSPGHTPIIHPFSERKSDGYNSQFFWIAYISRDGRDLAILTASNRVLLYRDFKHICLGEIVPVSAGRLLRLSSGDRCLSLVFKHRRLCIATVCIFLHISR